MEARMLRNAFQPWHIVLLVLVILLLFGGRRLPDLAKSVGQSLKIIKSEVKEITAEDTAPPVSASVANAESAAAAKPEPAGESSG
jgi:sec-independent protein translocase protein TatA